MNKLVYYYFGWPWMILGSIASWIVWELFHTHEQRQGKYYSDGSIPNLLVENERLRRELKNEVRRGNEVHESYERQIKSLNTSHDRDFRRLEQSRRSNGVSAWN